MSHVPANLALQLQRLLLGRLGELSLKRILLPTVTSLFSRVLTRTFSQGSRLANLVETNRVSLMLFTFLAIGFDFFGNIHSSHDQLCIKNPHMFLYFFAINT
jgi:hypothetical protein